MKDIIEGLNVWWESQHKKGYYILRTYTESGVVKVIKTHNVEVYYTCDKQTKLAFSFKYSCREVTESEHNKTLNKLKALLTSSLLEYIYSLK